MCRSSATFRYLSIYLLLFLKTLLWCSNATDSVTSLTVVLNASSVYVFSSGFSARTFLNFRLARLHIVSITLKSQLWGAWKITSKCLINSGFILWWLLCWSSNNTGRCVDRSPGTLHLSLIIGINYAKFSELQPFVKRKTGGKIFDIAP